MTEDRTCSRCRDQFISVLVVGQRKLPRLCGPCRDIVRELVTCDVCSTRHRYAMRYPAQEMRPAQGIDCASWTFARDGELWLQGGYGSSLTDLMVLRFVQFREELVDLDPVCDECVRGWLRSGLLVHHKDLTLVDEAL